MDSAVSIDDVDCLNAGRFSALGDAPLLIVDAAHWCRPALDIHALCIGVDRQGLLPPVNTDDFDLLLTVANAAPRPWVSVAVERFDAQIARLSAAVAATPIAATMLGRLLRLTEGLPFGDALEVESLAYSTLLGGAEFARWQRGRVSSGAAPPLSKTPPLRIERHAECVTITLNQPDRHNAMTATMRDALFEALANVIDDPSQPKLLLQGAGRCFSTGGALEEFGTATDVASAHVIRSLRNNAALLDRLGDRASVRLHGACIGAGLELPMSAAHRIASSNAWFQLPELTMGLIPGAGGTASVVRAIGRHRTVWMVLSAQRIAARQALAWGLVHRLST